MDKLVGLGNAGGQAVRTRPTMVSNCKNLADLRERLNAIRSNMESLLEQLSGPFPREAPNGGRNEVAAPQPVRGLVDEVDAILTMCHTQVGMIEELGVRVSERVS